MIKIKCPIKTCKGFKTTSGHPNLVNHIKTMAKSELFTNYILGKGKIKMPHAEWLKLHTKIRQVNLITINGRDFIYE
jgi:hypothetical protein